MGLFSKKQTNVPRRERMDSDTDRADRYAFHRNRTLTGSSSSNVSSVTDHNAQLQSPRTQVHHLTRRRRRVGAVFLVVALICIVLGIFLLQFTASVKVRASDVTTQLDSRYIQDIQTYLDRQPVERLRFLMDTKQLLAYVQSVAPEVAALDIDGSAGYASTSFVVTLRQPTLGWTIRSTRQYVDATGTAFTRNYFAEPQVQVVDESGIQVSDGQTIASNRFLGFMGRVVGLAKAHGYTVTHVILPRSVTREIDLQIDGISYPVKLSVDRPAGEEIEDMDRAVRWLRAHGQNPKYLDVRVGRRAYYQ
jgi:hypothetical protein